MTAIADLPGPRGLPGSAPSGSSCDRPEGYRRWREVERAANEGALRLHHDPAGLRVALRPRKVPASKV